MKKATITIETVIDTLADMASASVLKNLVGKISNETAVSSYGKLYDLRNALQIDRATLRKAKYSADRIQVLEMHNEALAEQVKTIHAEMRILRKRIEGEDDINKRASLEEKYSYAVAWLEDCKAERKANNEEIDILYKAISDTVQDGQDIKQTAFLAMWEHVETVKEWAKTHNITEDNVLEKVGNIVVEREYKAVRIPYQGISKGGDIATFYKAERDENGEIVKAWQDVTLRKVGARAANRYINAYRSKAANMTTSIITGYDEDGQELTIQTSRLETLGGVDSVEEKLDFETAWAKIGSVLTARQCEIIKLILAGFNYSDIATKLGVKENTVKTHVFQIREKAREVFPNWKK